MHSQCVCVCTTLHQFTAELMLFRDIQTDPSKPVMFHPPTCVNHVDRIDLGLSFKPRTTQPPPPPVVMTTLVVQPSL